MFKPFIGFHGSINRSSLTINNLGVYRDVCSVAPAKLPFGFDSINEPTEEVLEGENQESSITWENGEGSIFNTDWQKDFEKIEDEAVIQEELDEDDEFTQFADGVVAEPTTNLSAEEVEMAVFMDDLVELGEDFILPNEPLSEEVEQEKEPERIEIPIEEDLVVEEPEVLAEEFIEVEVEVEEEPVVKEPLIEEEISIEEPVLNEEPV